MKILVVNGSPAGEESITLQTLKYLEIKYPEHEYKVIHAARTIRKLEKDFSEAEDLLLWAELIVFAYPVYTFLVPSQLHRFLQLMKESRIDFASKYAAQVSTSKHFYDVTAHEFIRENCLDLGFMYLPGLSADMEDLLTEQGRKDARMFFEHLMFSIGEGMTEQREKEGTGEPALFEASLPEKSTEKRADKKVVLVADLPAENERLRSMIERFQAVLPYECALCFGREMCL